MDCHSFVLSTRTQKFFKDSQNLEDLVDFRNRNKTQELFSSKKVVVKFRIKTAEIIWIDEFISSRSKIFSFKGNDKNLNKLKGTSKSQSKKNMNFKNTIIV